MLKYRPEIDGLRAIAVSVVVLYHAAFSVRGVDPFKGGFIGVDIFFVISGYLITSILLRETAEGRFTFASFYERRARRILPALFLVMAASLPFAWTILLPKAMVEYAGSALAALGFGSNFWFWLEDSYWAEPSQLKPFLHTWSLAVEEQFYIFFPIALILCRRLSRPYLIGLFVLGFLASLQLAQFLSGEHQAAAFYLLPPRGWELLAGAVLAAIEAERGRDSHPVLGALMPPLGLFMMLHATVTFHDHMAHPSFLTLEPVAGAMLVIWFARPGEIVTDLLSSKPFVGVGLISYSFYLWHFPVFAFARVKGWAASEWVMAGLVLLSAGLAVLSSFLVERPARDKTRMPRRVFVPVIAAAGAVLAAVFAVFYVTNGLSRRLPADLYQTLEQVGAERKLYRENVRSTPVEDFRDDKISVVVIGNSFAIDVSYMFTFDDDFEMHIGGSTSPECAAFTLPKPEAADPAAAEKRCTANRETYFERDYSKADVVVLADQNSMASAHPLLRQEIEKNFALLREHGFKGPIIVFGDRPKYTKEIFEILRELGGLDGADKYAARYLAAPIDRLHARIASATEYYRSIGVYYYSPVDAMCAEAWCRIVSDEGKVLYHDDDHFSLEGDRFLSRPVTDYVRSVLAAEKAAL